MLHVISFAGIYEAVEQFNRSGRNPHGPSQPNPGDPVFMEIDGLHNLGIFFRASK